MSDRDETYWRPPLPVPDPCGLPRAHHSLTATRGAWLCGACDFATRDPGEAAAHLASSQYVVGWRPEPVATVSGDTVADERGDDR